jgi:CRISPR/Cas system CSM-associated protein Csm4 (group 5 of RAMP superfamily)
LPPNDSKEQVVENEKLAEVDRYLQMLRKEIWTLPTVQKMNDKQKDDISKGFAQSTEKILSDMRKGTEIYTNKTYVHNVLKRSISENNKKRKKAEYKISDDQLVKVIQEIETLQATDK